MSLEKNSIRLRLGISHNSLRMCLETLLMQPGINSDNVLVCLEILHFNANTDFWFQVAVDEKFSEPLTLIDLFKFRGIKTSSSSVYMGKRREVFDGDRRIVFFACRALPKGSDESMGTVSGQSKYLVNYLRLPLIGSSIQNEVIVVEEDLILSPDFLYTLALLSDTFQKDPTIGAIQMWNPNGRLSSDALSSNSLSSSSSPSIAYDIVNGSVDFIYRVDQFFGLGYLLKRSLYDKSIKASFKDCCFKR